jgi:hypothetical protein
MDYHSFTETLKFSATAPLELNTPLSAMWYDAQGDWNKAHTLVQDEETGDCAWVHAYLHRKEGDIWNADYWYRRVGRIRPNISIPSEWEAIVKELLSSEK